MCHLEVSNSVIVLSQFSSCTHKVHFLALWAAVFAFLNATTIDNRIYYWRKFPQEDLPIGDTPTPITAPNCLEEFPQFDDPLVLSSAGDSTSTNDQAHQCFIMGELAMMLVGGAVYYRTRLHPTIVLSSTEAEFYTMTDAGKVCLYFCSILHELNLK